MVMPIIGFVLSVKIEVGTSFSLINLLLVYHYLQRRKNCLALKPSEKGLDYAAAFVV